MNGIVSRDRLLSSGDQLEADGCPTKLPKTFQNWIDADSKRFSGRLGARDVRWLASERNRLDGNAGEERGRTEFG